MKNAKWKMEYSIISPYHCPHTLQILVVGQFQIFSHNKGQRLYWDRGRLARRERGARAKAAAVNIKDEQD